MRLRRVPAHRITLFSLQKKASVGSPRLLARRQDANIGGGPAEDHRAQPAVADGQGLAPGVARLPLEPGGDLRLAGGLVVPEPQVAEGGRDGLPGGGAGRSRRKEDKRAKEESGHLRILDKPAGGEGGPWGRPDAVRTQDFHAHVPA
ncbi:MAG: hypothetical protein LUQ69_09830 [Methanoregulaceae archaeon]|nr:hypothetical protein [Methanoregulaceae archaeon]